MASMAKVCSKYGVIIVQVWRKMGKSMAHIWLRNFFRILAMGMARQTMAHIWRSILWISNPGLYTRIIYMLVSYIKYMLESISYRL